MTGLASLMLALAAFALLATGMHRHGGQAGLSAATIAARRPLLRAGGFGLLALSALLRLMGSGWRFAIVEWVGELTLAAIAVAALIALAPRLLPRLGPAAAGIGLLASATAFWIGA